MAKLRSVNTHFWDDTYIVNLDPIEKLLFLYFLTNPLANIAGAYEINVRRIAFDTGIDKDMIFKIIKRFEESNKIIYQDGWIFIVNFIKNQSINPKITTGIEIVAKDCPDWIKHRLSIAYPSLSIAYDNLNLNSNSNSNSNATAKVSANGAKIYSENTNFDATESPYLNAALSTLQRKKMDSPFSMPDWYRTIAYTEQLHPDAEKFEKCIDSIAGWATGRITPKMVADHFGKFLASQEVKPFVNEFTGRGLK